jgi:hypothetical protein
LVFFYFIYFDKIYDFLKMNILFFDLVRLFYFKLLYCLKENLVEPNFIEFAIKPIQPESQPKAKILKNLKYL